MHHLFLFLAVLSLSQAANLVRWAHAPVEVIGFWRLLFVSMVLFPFALKNKNSIKKANSRILGITILSGAFLFLHFYTFFFAAQNTKIANAMIIFATNPLFTAAGAWFFFKEKMTWKLALAYCLAGLGIYNLFSQSFAFETISIKGDLSALVSAMLFSAYILTGRAARAHYENSLYTFMIYSVTGLLFGLTCLMTEVEMLNYPLNTWVAIASLAFVTTLLGHAMFTYLLNYMSVNFLSCAKLIEPVFSALVAFLAFSEELTSTTLAAFFFTATAVLTLYLPFNFKKNKI